MKAQLRAATAALAIVAGMAAPHASAAAPANVPALPYDVNGDGRQDLLVSAPGDNQGNGALHIALATRSGLRVGPSFLEGNAVVASGDFNADGRADIAVRTPNPAGNLIWLSYMHLRSASAAGIESHPERDMSARNDYDFGDALVVGDFNGDGYDDLAIGDPTVEIERVPGQPDSAVGNTTAGDVTVRYGSPTGLSRGTTREAGRYEIWDENTAGVTDGATQGDRFGASLAAADLNGDGVDDLVVGIPGKSVSGYAAAGAITELFGTATGLTSAGTQSFSLDTPGVRGHAARQPSSCSDEACSDIGEQFGSIVAGGDIDGDGYADVVVAVPFKNVVARIGTDSHGQQVSGYDGALSVLYSDSQGLTPRSQFRTLNSRGVPGQVTASSYRHIEFGHGLAVADFNGDGHADIAAGRSFARGNPTSVSGGAVVLEGGATGVRTSGGVVLRGEPHLGQPPQPGDEFGTELLAYDLTGDGRADLVAGVPNETVASARQTGALFLFRGARDGLSQSRGQRYTERSDGFDGDWSAGNQFGYVGTQLPVLLY